MPSDNSLTNNHMPLYNCREYSTFVESSLQINSFYAKQSQFSKSQVYVNKEMTRDYEKRTLGVIGKTKPNKANSKPIKANLKNAINERKSSFNKGLRKMSTWAIYPKQSQFKPKTNPILSRLDKACFVSCHLHFTVKSFRKGEFILFTKRSEIGIYWRIKSFFSLVI